MYWITYIIENPCGGYISYIPIFDIRRTFVDNQIVNHSDVVGASPVGGARTTSLFST